MAVFVELPDDDTAPQDAADARYTAECQARAAFETGGLNSLSIADQRVEVVNANRNSITEVFACYPAATIITSHIDLNTLDSLARSCRQIRENLLQFRSQLISRTLRCSNDAVALNKNHILRYRARATNWYFVEEDGGNSEGKVGECARDLVGGCRRCGVVVCRNCAIKPPAPILLHHRHRRLCPTCLSLPLPSLLSPPLPVPSPVTPVTISTLSRSVCRCASSGVWLCQPCGRSLKSADSTYDSIWRWRMQYSPTLAEGSRRCGRAGECGAAAVVEEEVDCDAYDLRDGGGGVDEADGRDGGRGDVVSPTPSEGSGGGEGSIRSGRRGAGYARHEIEGIGGVVKKKLIRRARVGACVEEWEDERVVGRFMVREKEGGRSWCGWCWRVVPGDADKVEWAI
ncbi:hypothetical protein VE02_05876 [Pseudogymnoascus sp. 03VT05]|nr:hypothetical protein VE02_05876 [Pseudogymnoascus sp. 03VT05]